MVLYQGSKFVRYNKFIDQKGNELVFEKNTKNGKLFKTAKGFVTLTENQANKLVLLKEKRNSK